MAPSFANLADDPDFDSDEEIDFSDLRAQHEVRMEQGLDTFVVVDGLPVVPEESKGKLVKFLLKKLTAAGQTREDTVFMPVNDSTGKTEGFAFVEYENSEQAIQAIKLLHGTPLDKRHTIAVNKITDVERYGREGRIDENYHAPEIEQFTEKEHLRWWLGEPGSRDQIVMHRGDNVGVFWNRRKEALENVVDRLGWTERFVAWSPLGTFLATTHRRGVQLWGGPSWGRLLRFPHPLCDLIDFSPGENYICTWSFKPIEVEEDDPILTLDEEGKNYIIWSVVTGKPLRSFSTHDLPGPSVDENGQPVKKRIPWPAFKWSSDDKYVARMLEGQSISVYELPKMNLLDRSTIKIEGIRDFEWAPAAPQREAVKTYEQLLSYWAPEMGANPARVSLMSIPSKEVVRTRNLFNVTDARLHWQSNASYLCVKVDRHSKSKKPLNTNLEIFRVREKGVPVEVVDSIKDFCINFAWEPKGDRFVIITTPELISTSAVPPKTSVSFFCPEKIKGSGVGNFKLIRTIDKKSSNGIYWSPKGRHVLVGTIASAQGSDLDFWDLDFEGEKPEDSKDLTANLQLVASSDHYGVTEVDWDSTGRYVITSGSILRQQIEHGYHIYDFSGQLMRDEHVEKLKQMLWRPRPPTLLSKDQQKQVRKNLREYSKDFEEEDRIADDKEKWEIVEHRRRLLSEWLAFRSQETEELKAERVDMGLPEELEEVVPPGEDGEPAKVVEEIVEEIVDETEEIIS